MRKGLNRRVRSAQLSVSVCEERAGCRAEPGDIVLAQHRFPVIDRLMPFLPDDVQVTARIRKIPQV